MLAPGEHKTVQARILKYAQKIGWTFLPRALFRTLLHPLLAAPSRTNDLALTGLENSL